MPRMESGLFRLAATGPRNQPNNLSHSQPPSLDATYPVAHTTAPVTAQALSRYPDAKNGILKYGGGVEAAVGHAVSGEGQGQEDQSVHFLQQAHENENNKMGTPREKALERIGAAGAHGVNAQPSADSLARQQRIADLEVNPSPPPCGFPLYKLVIDSTCSLSCRCVGLGALFGGVQAKISQIQQQTRGT